MFTKKKSARTLVLISDSVCWNAVISGANSETQVMELESASQVPRELLDWGRSQGAINVTFVLPSNISLVEMNDLSDDLDSLEIHDAIVWESAENEGFVPDEVQLTLTAAKQLNIGCGDSTWVVSHIKRRQIDALQQACENSNLNFTGVASLQQIALLYLSSLKEQKGRVFAELDGESGFVAIPGKGGKSPIVRQLSAGLPSEDSSSHDTWGQRLARRMNAANGLPITMMTLKSNLTEIQDHVKCYLPKEEVVLLSLHDVLEQFGELAVLANPYDVNNLSVAVLPLEPKDPRTTATYIGLTILTLVVLALGANWWNLKHSVDIYQKRIDLQSQLKSVRSAASGKISAQQNQLSSFRAQYNFLQDNDHFKHGFEDVLTFVSTEIPEYSRLESFEYSLKGIRLRIATLWQNEVALFTDKLSRLIKKYDLTVVLGNISKDGSIIIFDVQILNM